MTASTRSGWFIPVGLLVLSVLPLIGGTIRLTQLATGADITSDNARFFAAPEPIVIHALSSLLYFVFGAFQFWPGLRQRNPAWHRAAGRILVPSGLICALSGIWMATTYPPIVGDGTAIMLIRVVVGAAMAAFVCLGVAAIKRRAIQEHRAWMMRAYALAIAAGTQPLTLLPYLIVPGMHNEAGFTAGLAAGWILNLTVAEWLIRKPTKIDRLVARH